MDLHKCATLCKYRKISPAAYIFQRPFLRGSIHVFSRGARFVSGNLYCSRYKINVPPFLVKKKSRDDCSRYFR